MKTTQQQEKLLYGAGKKSATKAHAIPLLRHIKGIKHSCFLCSWFLSSLLLHHIHATCMESQLYAFISLLEIPSLQSQMTYLVLLNWREASARPLLQQEVHTLWCLVVTPKLFTLLMRHVVGCFSIKLLIFQWQNEFSLGFVILKWLFYLNTLTGDLKKEKCGL